MTPESDSHSLRVLSDEEMEAYLRGDRREVDKLILLSINRLSRFLIPRATKEDERAFEISRLINSLGGTEMLEKRARYVDALIKQSEAKTRMMEKVGQSSVLWVLLPFFGFAASSMWESAIKAIKAAILRMGGQ